MPEKLTRCFLKVKKRLRKEHKKWSSQRIDRVARAICVKSTGQKFVKHSDADDILFNVTFGESGNIKGLEFQFQSDVEFIERADLEKFRPAVEINDPESIFSVGTALWATESKNFNRYDEKEVRRAASTLKGRPCQKDHNESVESTFGVVQDAWWDRGTEPAEIGYVSELEGSDPVSHKVRKGYVRAVSVAGVAEEILCSICGEEWSWAHEHWPGKEYDGETCYRDLKKITFRHLGFTNFPGIEGADTQYVPSSVDEAIENAFAYVDYLRESEDDDQYDEKKLTTKARKGLPDSAFAIPRLRALPIHDCSHVRNAMARWNQVKGATSAEKASAKRKILAKAKSCGIDVKKFAKSDADMAAFMAFGETISMSTEQEKEYLMEIEREKLKSAQLAQEKADLEAKIEESTKLQQELDRLRAAEKERLISEIIDLETKLKMGSKKAEERRAELEGLSTDVLEAKVSVLRDVPLPQDAVAEQITAGSRSKVFSSGSKFHELDQAKQEKYIREAKLEQLNLGLFGHLPSVSAVQTLKEWDPQMDRWRTDLSDLFKRVPKQI